MGENMNISKKMRKLFAAFAAVAVALTGSVFLAPISKAADVSLTMYSWRVEDKAFYEDVIKDYTAANPGVKITYQSFPSADYQTILMSAMAAGKGPDIVHVRAYGALDQLVVPGYLSPLAANEIKGLSKYPKDALDSQRGFSDKRLFGIPFAYQSLGIFYNLDYMRKAGINLPPKTYPEFVAQLKKIKDAGLQPLANGGSTHMEQMWGTIAPMFYGGTDYYNDVVAGKKTFNDPAFVKSLEAVQELFPYMPANATAVNYDASRALFFSGKAAFFLGGIFELGYFRAQNPKLKFDFMATPPMTAGGKQFVSTWADGGYGINAKTSNRAESLKFINYLASKSYGQRFTEKIAQISAVPGVVIKDRQLNKAVSSINKGGTPYIMLVGFRYKNPTGSALLQTGLPNMLNGTKTAKQVADEVTKGVATWFAPFAGKI
jgi:raffinose/stachyose/melibiose transport system substrate-binding protein